MINEIKSWQSKFRILADWDIRYEESDEYVEQCGHNAERKTAVIYPGKESDYVYHEILHICQAHLRHLCGGEYKIYREAVEQYVQDLCVIKESAEAHIPTRKCPKCGGRFIYAGLSDVCITCSRPRIMDVQPMPQPASLIYYLEQKRKQMNEDNDQK